MQNSFFLKTLFFLAFLSQFEANAQVRSEIKELRELNSKFSIGVESQFLIAGELNASFDFLAGANGYYFFPSKKKFTPFMSVGFSTDLASTNARILSTDLQLGTKWNFSQQFSVLMSIGGNYINESHAHRLIERQIFWNNELLSLSGKIGVNFQISKPISSTLFVHQINLNFTSIGLSINYSF